LKTAILFLNKGNAKRGVSPCLKIWPCDLWPWKSIRFQILVRTKYVPTLDKIHWRMLILECSQGCYAVKNWPGGLDLWPRKSIGFQILLKTKYVPSLFTRMLRKDGRKRYYIPSQLRWRGDNKTLSKLEILLL
jgi:hypothetical protein